MQNMITALKMHSKFIPMKTKNLIVAAICLGSAFIVQQASAQAYTAIDTLGNHTSGQNLAGQVATDGATWQNAGAGSASAVTIGTAASGGLGAISDPTGLLTGSAYIALPTAIAIGSIDTVYFTFDAGANPTDNNNMNWSVENLTTATSDSTGSVAGASEVTEMNVNESSRNITMRNGNAFQNILVGATSTVWTPQASTVYNIWMVINNASAGSTPTYNIWMSGGTGAGQPGATAVEMGINTAASYTGTDRNTAVTDGSAISDFIFGPGGTFTANGGSGESLLTLGEFTGNQGGTLVPTPEPGTMALMGLGGAALLLVRRNRKA
jgi:hypothetical protein